MPEYLIYFNQQWVGDHTEEWFRERGPLAGAVVEEIKAAGAFVFAGGLEEEDGPVFSADATSGETVFTDGPYVESKEFLGGLTIVDVPDERPPGCGPAGSRRLAAGRRRSAGSSRDASCRSEVFTRRLRLEPRRARS
ncbi:YciI family protein [Actinoplanes sp. URMC 104]|uniref:YciI family protein n=1 Tax=Actinoplanes sp. URMC 104 TaxID=3423409 RepID=UPI003F1B2253